MKIAAAPQKAATFDLATQSGDVRLIVPKSANASIRTRTVSGETEIPDAKANPSKTRTVTRDKSGTLELGDGSADISVKSTSGDITIDVK